MTDVLIAGGGIAGSALAILLGRRGLSVELFERTHFPREKPCGEGLMPAGVGVIERLGLKEAVGGVRFYGVRYHFGDQVAEGRFPRIASVPATGLGQRRKHLDHLLFRTAAATAGVKAHIGTRVNAPLWENGRVAGAFVEGEPRRAALVVAADGLHSRLRHRLGLHLPSRRKRFGIRAHFRLAPDQVEQPWVDVFVGAGYELYVTPLPDREILVAGLANAETLDEPIERAFERWRHAHRVLALRLEGAEQLTSLLGSSPLSGRARSGVARGVVLLGDAAGALDPITGGGMTHALLTAELLAKRIPEKQGTSDQWLWSFERERNALLRDYRTLTRGALWLADHPRLAGRLLPMLRISPALSSHLVGVSGGVGRLLGWSGAL